VSRVLLSALWCLQLWLSALFTCRPEIGSAPRGDVHENRAECLFSLLKPYLRVFRGLSKTNLPGYVSFFQFLRNFRSQNAFEQTELILWAALDPVIARRARRGEFVKSLDHFDLLQTAIN
jgi:hypothetical protein